MPSTKVNASLNFTAKPSPAELPTHSDLQFWEKENDHTVPSRKCGRKQQDSDVAGEEIRQFHQKSMTQWTECCRLCLPCAVAQLGHAIAVTQAAASLSPSRAYA